MTNPSLRTHPVNTQEDVRQFFDGIASTYRESHGAADQLLNYRLRLIQSLLPPAAGGRLLEIGCGTGIHLFPLAGRFDQADGTDLSPGMIAQAEAARMQHPAAAQIRFAVDQAEMLAGVDSGGIDVVLCVGAFEHMLDQPAVLHQVNRILKPNGVFICLTPNGDYVWYTRLARRLGLASRHLSTDRFLTATEFASALQQAGLHAERLGYWTFIPRGDMPRPVATVLTLLDGLGRLLNRPSWRGGLYCRAVKSGGAGL
ncbi:MAG: class I SAM-dependent methyltransferase [Methylococcaceae bacterium]|nr:MAG: class I SAM-dependent methyltransferase [Methylococcaceae bacterium]